MKKQTGQTKDVGFQFGLRKTFPLPFEQVWDFIFSDRGLRIWLGDLQDDLQENQTYHTTDGIEGLVRVFKHHSHIRMNWKRKEWDHMSTVQVRVIKNGDKSTVSFHQEKLLNAEQREAMKTYWNEKMNDITGALL